VITALWFGWVTATLGLFASSEKRILLPFLKVPNIIERWSANLERRFFDIWKWFMGILGLIGVVLAYMLEEYKVLVKTVFYFLYQNDPDAAHYGFPFIAWGVCIFYFIGSMFFSYRISKYLYSKTFNR
jgi:hypothetical protein